MIRYFKCMMTLYTVGKNIDAVDDSSGTQDIALDENIGEYFIIIIYIMHVCIPTSKFIASKIFT